MGKKKKIRKANDATKVDKNDPFNWWNKFWIVLTTLIIIVEFIGLIFFYKTFQTKSIIILSFGIPFILMIFQYRQLRKTRVFIVWLIISLLLYGLFLYLKFSSNFLSKDYLYEIKGLKVPLCFLIAFYLFQKISTSIWKTQLIMPSRGSRYDDEEGRKTNLMDYFSFFLYWIIIVFTYMY
jgi:hypothetical protein